MDRRLTIYSKTGTFRHAVEKWEFHDTFMGEQFVSLSVNSPQPIAWAVGDWLEYRGERYSLNYIPSVEQNARRGASGKAFVYENIKFTGAGDELTRCEVLDIVPTSGDHIAAYGTNYTGSGEFVLDCYETTFTYQGETKTYCSVHVLLDKIKANLDRLYPTAGWQIYIDDSVCHTEDFSLSVSHWTAAKALAEVHNTFKLDYVVRGRKIVVGDVSGLLAEHPELQGMIGGLTDINGDGKSFYFGYGRTALDMHGEARGDNDPDGEDGMGLFQIKENANSEQAIITRLRVVGSTRNMPYNYYFKKYELPQTMFLQNLQLPDTFLPPAGKVDKKRDGDPENKSAGNAVRDSIYGTDADGRPNVRHVLGDTNDAYIEKWDDAESTPEGIREGSARWDGSDGELPEIYPTISEGTYSELRANGVADMDGKAGVTAFPHYDGDERIDTILGLGDKVNYGDGKQTDRDVVENQEDKGVAMIGERSFSPSYDAEDGVSHDNADSAQLFVTNMAFGPGTLALGYNGVPHLYVRIDSVPAYRYGYTPAVDVYVRMEIYPENSNVALATFTFHKQTVTRWGDVADFTLPDFNKEASGHEQGTWSTNKLRVDASTRLRTVISLNTSAIVIADGTKETISGENLYTATWWTDRTVKAKDGDAVNDVEPRWIVSYADGDITPMNEPFYLIIKDNGIDWENITKTEDSIVLSMKSGQCAGKDFNVLHGDADGVERVTTDNGRKGWKLKLERYNDNSIYAYFPSAISPIVVGDEFVVLGLALPDAYIKAAETRLLVAATEYLSDNCETKFTYQPALNGIYLQRDIDRNEQAGTIEKSIWWRLYAGLKFPFRGVPKTANADDPLPISEITIEQVVIREGDKPTPQVEITLNNDIQQTTMEKLQTSVDRIYGSVFSGTAGAAGVGNTSMLMQLFKTEGAKRFLSKTDADTAAGRITLAGGADVRDRLDVDGTASVSGDMSVGGDAKVDGSADVDGNVTIGGTVHSDGFVSGLTTGRGWQVDERGNAEVESLRVRSLLEVTETLINRQQAQEGDTVFAENDQIEAVEERVDETDGSTSYILTLKEKWDGYVTAQQYGNILRGVVNTLAAKAAGVSDVTDTVESDGSNSYYTAWMRVTGTHATDANLGVNQLRVVMYGDNDVPAGRNFPPCALMSIARWGCVDYSAEYAGTPEQEAVVASIERRQTSFYVSSSDGRIIKLRGVDSPILRNGNYGGTFGTLPEFVREWDSVQEKYVAGRDYLYAQGIVVGSVIHVTPEGLPIPTVVYTGEWEDGREYLYNEYNPETQQYEIHEVRYNGGRWQCLQHQPVMSGGTSVYYPPKWNSPYWTLVDGNDNLSIEFLSSGGDRFRRGAVDTTITPYFYYGNVDISADIAEEYWSWTRESQSGKTEQDATWDAQHKGQRRLVLTDADMPTAWGRNNLAIFTCTVTLNDGKTTQIIQNHFSI